MAELDEVKGLDETFGEGAEAKLQSLFDEHDVPVEAAVELSAIALKLKPSKKDFYLKVTAVQKAHKIQNVFYLQFADYVAALGKKGAKKVTKEKKGAARKESADAPVMMQVGSIACGAEGIMITIPWDEVRRHLPAPSPLPSLEPLIEAVDAAASEPVKEQPPLRLVEPVVSKAETAPTTMEPRPNPERIAQLPTPTGNREPSTRLELVNWYIAAICGGARYGGNPSIWDRILYNSMGGSRRRIIDIAEKSGGTVEQVLKFLRTQYDSTIVHIEMEGEFVSMTFVEGVEV